MRDRNGIPQKTKPTKNWAIPPNMLPTRTRIMVPSSLLFSGRCRRAGGLCRKSRKKAIRSSLTGARADATSSRPPSSLLLHCLIFCLSAVELVVDHRGHGLSVRRDADSGDGRYLALLRVGLLEGAGIDLFHLREGAAGVALDGHGRAAEGGS